MWLLFWLWLSPVSAVDWNEFSASVGILVNKGGGTSTCSGILLSPRIVLTAAHCVDGYISAQVSNEMDLQNTTALIPVVKGFMHPGYRGNLPGGSVDVGLLFLERPLIGQMKFPEFGTVDENLPFERIGYGGRQGENVRTWMTSFFEVWFGAYIKARDKMGVLGDSGGPVFQRQDGKLKLIGVHTGREIGSTGQLESMSFIQPIGTKERDWITRQSQSL